MGGERSEKTAKEIAVDVSKYLKYACGRRCPVADWGRLTDHDMLIGYFEKLKRVKEGPEGRLSKMDALCAAMRFMKVHVVVQESNPLYSELSRAEVVLQGWKKTMRKQKR